MKFVLVINVADDVAEAYEDFTVDYDFRGTPKEDRTVNESIKYVEDAEPRPLPEKHGRLIDADELKKHKYHDSNRCENAVAVAYIDWADTIIEADTGETE